jgi:uncharacterized BrkB/YihY/UPF0761 family membrane protein
MSDEAQSPKPPRTWDFLLTLLLIIITLVLAVAFAISAVGLGVTNQACSAEAANCSETRVQVGQLICTYAPIAIALIVIIWSIIRVLRRKIGFWIVAVGIVLMSAAFLVGRLILDSGIPASVH